MTPRLVSFILGYFIGSELDTVAMLLVFALGFVAGAIVF